MEVTSELYGRECLKDVLNLFQSLFSWKLHQSSNLIESMDMNQICFNPCFHGSYIRAPRSPTKHHLNPKKFQSLFSWKLHQSVEVNKDYLIIAGLFQSLFSWKLHQSSTIYIFAFIGFLVSILVFMEVTSEL
ncbi:hypothetical protein MHK_006916 [Candidatus Magnetomorum sp. HK-1]|nr:hypothetical protein MHK_006916 [Candidatus Magnetomorum sp. HK-1]